MKKQTLIPFILASTSPRRVELLKNAGLTFQVIPPRTEEIVKKGEKPKNLVMRLAREKATAVRDQFTEKKDVFYIGADTIVVSPDGNEILGKPKDKASAEKMLKTLSGKTHIVFTGYCIIRTYPRKKDRVICKVVKSKVTLKVLSKNSIQEYVKSGEPLDKAGSYGAQGMGMSFIETIQGSYSNVVGLPICQIFSDLEEQFGISLFSWN